MIGREEINSVARDLQVNAADVERDYVFGWLLANLFGQSRLRDRLVLRGGNALRKGYFANTRYSDDLDFATSGGISLNELLAICDAATAGSGVTFLNHEAIVQEKRRIDDQLQVLEARLYFRDFYGKQGHVRVKVRIEKLEEILASKLKCLLQRRHVADLFDYVHWLFFGPEDVDTRLVISTFLHKTIYSRQPSAALELLLNLPLQILRDAWTKYIVCPARAVLAFETALGRFAEHVRSIFAPFGATDRAWFSRRVFFPSALRNVILDAGSRLTLVKVKYQGVERLVEPYSLRYKQRKDGEAREYFY
ncbi:MAG TPA: nucleotidyl transferase AbiEii/AbiGii toxin family protein, partial [Polyangiaceae bacterium]|nr:nucleotidyl transferase AbiEii/AbiGii toxin family protein [Polyangiaceae bacterium]